MRAPRPLWPALLLLAALPAPPVEAHAGQTESAYATIHGVIVGFFRPSTIVASEHEEMTLTFTNETTRTRIHPSFNLSLVPPLESNASVRPLHSTRVPTGAYEIVAYVPAAGQWFLEVSLGGKTPPMRFAFNVLAEEPFQPRKESPTATLPVALAALTSASALARALTRPERRRP